MAVDQAALLAAVERIHDAEAVVLLSDLVRLDSTLGNESAVQAHMGRLLAGLGLEVDTFPVELDRIKDTRGFSPVDWTYDKKVNVVGIHKPKEVKGKSLIFNGHVDVVPVDGAVDQWRAPPFQPVVRDGRLYGRGSGDMKGGIVCFIVAYKALLSLGFKPAAPLYFHAVIEEECTGNGTLACTVRGYNKADAVIIPEPFPCIVSAQLGVMWFRVAVRGKPVHVLEAGSGINAIEASYVLYGALKQLEEKMNAPEVRHSAYKDVRHPINFNFGVVHGGDWPSSVPSFCQFDVRVGFFPGVALVDIRREVEECVAKAAASAKTPITYTLSYRGFQAEGCIMDTNSDALKTLARLHKTVNGADVVVAPITATTDARFYSLYHNIPATCYGPEAMLIHGIDESVSLNSMKQVAKVYAAYIAEWCGVEKH